MPKEGKKTYYPIIIDGKYGFIDQKGKVVYKPSNAIFNPGDSFSITYDKDRLPVIIKENKKTSYGYVDVVKKVIIKTTIKMSKQGYFSDGLAWYKAKDGTYGYIDSADKQVIKSINGIVSYFRNGVALVKSDKDGEILSRYIDKKGNVIFKFLRDKENFLDN